MRSRAIARRLVPVGVGVLTWLLVLLVAGALLSMGSVSPGSLFTVLLLAVLFVPVYRARPWVEGVTGRVVGFARRRRRTLAATAGLFVLVRLPVAPDLFGPVVRLLLLPLRAVPQLLFGASVFYGERFGDAAGRVVYSAGRLYVEFLWLFVLGSIVAKLVPGSGGGD